MPENPAAFPNDAVAGKMQNCDGMTLRDYFAAKSFSFLSEHMNRQQRNMSYEMVAQNAYAVADAMLTEREKTTNTP